MAVYAAGCSGYPMYSGCGYAVAPGYVVPGGPAMKRVENGAKPDKDKGKGKDKDKDDEISAPARVVIKAAADVRITFNGQATPRRSTEETFLTPELAPGRTYAYRVVASAVRDGKPVTRDQRITVRAGRRTVLDLTNLGDERTVEALGDPAKVTVLMPQGARLSIDGQDFGRSTKQTFTTPKLEKGRKFYYTIQTETDVRRVTVESGKTVTVDFRTRKVASR
jgi:uncharacterized protein (TIGR03000 family)